MNRPEDRMKVDVAELRLGRWLGWPLVTFVMGQAPSPRAQEPQTKAQAPAAKAADSAAWPAGEGRPGGDHGRGR